MITIFHHPKDKDVCAWKDCLDQLIVKYDIIEQPTTTVPRLVDDQKQVEGKQAIEAYLDVMEEFVKGWYEDRCDKYEFDSGN